MIASQLFLIHQRGQSTGSGDLHCVGDLSGTHIQRTAEYSGEAQHVVYLIRKIRTPCGHHRCAGCVSVVPPFLPPKRSLVGANQLPTF